MVPLLESDDNGDGLKKYEYLSQVDGIGDIDLPLMNWGKIWADPFSVPTFQELANRILVIGNAASRILMLGLANGRLIRSSISRSMNRIVCRAVPTFSDEVVIVGTRARGVLLERRWHWDALASTVGSEWCGSDKKLLLFLTSLLARSPWQDREARGSSELKCCYPCCYHNTSARLWHNILIAMHHQLFCVVAAIAACADALLRWCVDLYAEITSSAWNEVQRRDVDPRLFFKFGYRGRSAVRASRFWANTA